MAGRVGGFRHLVYFIDGTWLWPGSKNTFDVYSNIYRLNLLLEATDKKGRAQIVHYARGLGAVESQTRRYTAGGFAFGIDDLIADLYINICSNYEPGDKLYIFGFSRGAVVARALTGLIARGILKDKHINMFSHVWARYLGAEEVLEPGLHEGTTPKQKVIDYSSLCSDISPVIEFVGLFDTVAGGHGPSEIAQRLRLGNCTVHPNVKNAVQLLAIDETRTFFKPVLWTGTDNGVSRPQYFEQIWVPGVHADVGGAYYDRGIGDISLLTMLDRIIAKTDLSFDLDECVKSYSYKAPPMGSLIRIHNEYNKWWRLACPIPQTRTINPNIGQSVHPFAKWLDTKPVKWKGQKRQHPYHLPDQIRCLPEAKEFLTRTFTKVFS